MPIISTRRQLAALGCLLGLLGAAGCGSNPDGPVRPAGSIDIPESALKNRSANERINKLQNDAMDKAKAKAATPSP